MSRCSIEAQREVSQHVSRFLQLLEGQFLHHAKLTELLTILARPGRTSSIIDSNSQVFGIKIISNYTLFNLHYKSSKKTPIYWLGCISCHIQAKHSGIAVKKLQAKSLSLPSKLLTPSVHWTPHSSPWTKVKRSRYVWTKEFFRRTKDDLWKGKTRSQISASGSWLKTSCLKWWGKRNAQDVSRCTDLAILRGISIFLPAWHLERYYTFTFTTWHQKLRFLRPLISSDPPVLQALQALRALHLTFSCFFASSFSWLFRSPDELLGFTTIRSHAFGMTIWWNSSTTQGPQSETL